MEQHRFKIIHSNEDDVYQIIDLTDTALVGVTEMFENDDYLDRQKRAEYTREIKENKGLGARIVGYGIFITFDDENTKWVPVKERDYMLSVLRQMAKAFEQEIIKNNPQDFEVYRIPQGRKASAKEPPKDKKTLSKWLKGWRLAVLISLAVLFICFTVCLIAFPAFRNTVGYVLEIVFGFPIILVVFLAYADDMFARR